MEDPFKKMPSKHLTEAEKQYMYLLIEKSRLDRERAHLIMDKGVILFFAFLVASVVLMQNQVLTKTVFNLLVVSAVCVLIVAVTPYASASKKTDQQIDELMKKLTGKL